MAAIYWVDLPDPHNLAPGGALVNVGTFRSRKEAEVFVFEHIVGRWNMEVIDFFISEGEDLED